MAFGAGVLISAVAYELVHEAFETSAGDGEIAPGLLRGSAVFFGGEVLIERLGAAQETSSSGSHTVQAGRSFVLGIILDGIVAVFSPTCRRRSRPRQPSRAPVGTRLESSASGGCWRSASG
jgi:zinc transporter ZupT